MRKLYAISLTAAVLFGAACGDSDEPVRTVTPQDGGGTPSKDSSTPTKPDAQAEAGVQDSATDDVADASVADTGDAEPVPTTGAIEVSGVQADLSEEEDLSSIHHAHALLADITALPQFEQLDALGEPPVPVASPEMRPTFEKDCASKKELSLIQRTLTLTYNCTTQNTTGEILVVRRNIANNKYLFIHFTDAFIFRGTDIDGTLVLKKETTDNHYQLFPGPSTKSGIDTFNGKQDTNDKVLFRRRVQNKHRLAKLFFTGLLIRNTTNKTISVTFSNTASNRLGFFKPTDDGATDPQKESDFSPIFSDMFALDSPKGLVWDSPPECACPKDGQIKLAGKHMPSFTTGVKMTGVMSMIHSKGIVFRRYSDALDLVDLDKETLTAFSATAINDILKKAQEKDPTLTKEQLTAIVSKLTEMSRACSNSKQSLTLSGLTVEGACFDYGTGLLFDIAASLKDIGGALTVSAVNKTTCGERDPVADGFLLDQKPDDLAPYIPSLEAYGKALVDKVGQSAKANYVNDTGKEYLWTAKTLRIMLVASLKKDKEAFYSKVQSSIASKYTEATKSMKLCATQ